MPKKPSREALAALEALSSMMAVGAIAATFMAYVSAHLAFFGEPDVIYPDEVRLYWRCVAVLSGAVVSCFALAALRHAGRAFIWHTAVALVGLVVGLLCAVTQTGPVRSDPPEPPEPSHGPVGRACHSGGDNHECLGG